MGLHLCIQCGTNCSSVKALKKHQKDVHSQSKTTCSQCQKNFENYKQKMENHLSSHQTIVCTGCNLEMPKNSKSTHVCGEKQPKNTMVLKLSESWDHKFIWKRLCPHMCPTTVWEQVFLQLEIWCSELQALALHNVLYPCDQCDYKSTNEISILRHIYTIHWQCSLSMWSTWL